MPINLTVSLLQSLQIGFLSSRNEGTSGSYFVDPATGSDAGTAGAVGDPFETVAHAYSVAVSGDVVKLRAGLYREAALAPPAGVTTSRYGTERAVFTGAEPLTGLTACTSGDEAVVGANFASIYKATLPLTSFPDSDPRLAWIHEDGEHLQPAMLRIPDARFPFAEDYTPDYLTADEDFTVNDSGNVTGIKLTSATSGFTKTQIERCELLFTVVANFHERSGISDFDTATDVITPSVTTATAGASNDPNYRQATLMNLLPAMKRGEWGYTISGSDATLYVWPLDEANIAADMEYVARGRCIDLGTRDDITLRGLEFEKIALESSSGGENVIYGQSVGTSDTPLKTNNLTIDNVKFRNIYSLGPSGDSVISPRLVDNLTLRNYEIDTALNMSGILAYGGFSVNTLPFTDDKFSFNGLIGYGTMRRVTNTPIIVRSNVNSIVAFHRDVGGENGVSPHAGKSVIKFGGYRTIFFACKFSGDGYVTFSDSSAPSLINSVVGVSTKGTNGRGVADQTFSSATMYADDKSLPTTGYLLNSMVMPYMPRAEGNTNSVSLGQNAIETYDFQVKNSIFHGHTPRDQVTFNSNIWTSGTTTGTNGITSDVDEYVDAVAGDFAFAPGAEARSITPANAQSIIASLASTHTQFSDWNRDYNGNTIDWSAPHFGPVGVDGEFDGWIVNKGVLVGSPTTGQSVSVAQFFAFARPLPTLTYQWVSSNNGGVTWVNISGETSATYTVSGGIEGDLLGVRVTPGNLGDPYIIRFQEPVAATYPIGDPARIAAATGIHSTGSASAIQLEGGAFESDGSPLLVVVWGRYSTSSDATVQMTLGDALRTFGTGDVVLSAPEMIASRSIWQAHTFAILSAPGTTESPVSKTIQIDPDHDGTRARIDVFKVSGMTGVGKVTDNSAATTTASLISGLRNAAVNRGAFYTTIVAEGATGISFEEGTEIFMGDSGGNTATDIAVAVSYQRAADIREHSVKVRFAPPKTAALRGLEIIGP